ncbi:hypothetical protein ACHLPL_15515 (plasmid) [Enterococcus faecalis]
MFPKTEERKWQWSIAFIVVFINEKDEQSTKKLRLKLKKQKNNWS